MLNWVVSLDGWRHSEISTATGTWYVILSVSPSFFFKKYFSEFNRPADPSVRVGAYAYSTWCILELETSSLKQRLFSPRECQEPLRKFVIWKMQSHLLQKKQIETGRIWRLGSWIDSVADEMGFTGRLPAGLLTRYMQMRRYAPDEKSANTSSSTWFARIN